MHTTVVLNFQLWLVRKVLFFCFHRSSSKNFLFKYGASFMLGDSNIAFMEVSTVSALRGGKAIRTKDFALLFFFVVVVVTLS